MPRAGSSPRARGTRMACMTPRRSRSVHPRGRGEHLGRLGLLVVDYGSSPRARGTLPVPEGQLRELRFIPAGAGNTTARIAGPMMFSVHPRGRGEHIFKLRNEHIVCGSSPRARGTRRRRRHPLRARRFIPAGAGNTVVNMLTVPRSAVHPRGRGEHLQSLRKAGKIAGSSPRARGTQGRPYAVPQVLRFIPAGAGNTAP